MKIALLAAITLFGAFSLSQAHEVWIEEKDGQLVVRFAEYGEDFEKSPGHLDGLAAPAAWTSGEGGKPKALEVEKLSDGFILKGAEPAKATLAETHYAVMKRGEGPARKPFFYARWHHAKAGEAKNALVFDIVPTGTPGEVQVFFRGKPVADAKITVVSPEPKEAELTTDKDGKAKFTLDKPGNYLLYGKHQREDVAGFSGGVAFDSVSHNCSLIWKHE